MLSAIKGGSKSRGGGGRRGSQTAQSQRNSTRNNAHNIVAQDQDKKNKTEFCHLKQKGASRKQIAYNNVLAVMSADHLVISDLHRALSKLVLAYSYRKLGKSVGWGNVASHLENMTKEDKEEMDKDRWETIKGICNMLRFIDKARIPKDNMKIETFEDVDKLRVICWDLGNQTIDYLAQRMIAFADFIQGENFDILLLQKVNPIVAKYLKRRFDQKYTFIASRNIEEHELQLMDVNYTLISQRMHFVSSKIIYFGGTIENRTLLKVKVEIDSKELFILNAHLESKVENSEKRIMQLRKCFDIMQNLSGNVIFGGNLNVRDRELHKIIKTGGTLREWDLWNKLGNDDNKFTWDLRVNKLFQYLGEAPQPFCRFDRMYFRSGQSALLHPVSFDLTGREIVAGGKYCVSDHYGIITEFNIREGNESDYDEDSDGCSEDEILTFRKRYQPGKRNNKKKDFKSHRTDRMDDLERGMEFVRLDKASHRWGKPFQIKK